MKAGTRKGLAKQLVEIYCQPRDWVFHGLKGTGKSLIGLCIIDTINSFPTVNCSNPILIALTPRNSSFCCNKRGCGGGGGGKGQGALFTAVCWLSMDHQRPKLVFVFPIVQSQDNCTISRLV